VKIDRLLQTLWRRTPIFGQFPTKTVKFTTDPSHRGLLFGQALALILRQGKDKD
jgi:hypothetical protein